MAYQALYRKYRPAAFDQMVGQKQIVQTLQNAVNSGRVSHAYLFCGPRGTGKTSAAKIFAKALNCESGQDRPCGKCRNCTTDNHPDIIEIDAASNNGVEEVRNLIERVKYAPMMGKYKVYIIDEVHMMTAGAFNALLKTIEEPPAHVIFILATTEPQKVLPTIISRCQRYDFRKVSQTDIVSRLMQIAGEEHLQLDLDAARNIAVLCQGGMRDALSILDQCIAYSPSHVTARDVRDVYGVLSQQDIADLFARLVHGDVGEVMEELQHISDNGMDLKRLTQDLISLLKDSMILQFAPETTLLDADRKELLQKDFMAVPYSFRTDFLELLMNAYQRYPTASSVLDYLEAAFLNALHSPEKSEQKDNNQISAPQTSSDFPKHSYEKPSEHAEIPKKTTNPVGKSTDLPVSQISDVSRETNPPEKKEFVRSEIHEMDDEFILGLLAGADRNLRMQDLENWKKIGQFRTAAGLGQAASVLLNAKVVASAANYVLVETKSEIEAQMLNSDLLENLNIQLMKNVLGTAKKVFALSNRRNFDIVKKFRQRMQSNSLPPVPEVQFTLEEAKEPVTDELSEIRRVFPDVEIIED